MEPLHPEQPCTTFRPRFAQRTRKTSGSPRFIEQNGRRFVIKSLSTPEFERELETIAAFEALGVAALAPLGKQATTFTLHLDGNALQLLNTVVFPYRDTSTLFHELSETPNPLKLIAEAGERIQARHRQASSLREIHSDGSCHNVFSDWTWFDFSASHTQQELPDAKAHELWRFLTSTVEVTPPGQAAPRVAAFCEGYGDTEILHLLADQQNRYAHPSAFLSHPVKAIQLACGQTQHLRRPRTARALAGWLRQQPHSESPPN